VFVPLIVFFPRFPLAYASRVPGVEPGGNDVCVHGPRPSTGRSQMGSAPVCVTRLAAIFGPKLDGMRSP